LGGSGLQVVFQSHNAIPLDTDIDFLAAIRQIGPAQNEIHMLWLFV
jgi:hypothetical protein